MWQVQISLYLPFENINLSKIDSLDLNGNIYFYVKDLLGVIHKLVDVN
jgi:hypothetical protein